MFKKYVSKNKANRQKFGIQVSSKALVMPSEQLLLAHVMAKKDQENDGVKPDEAYDMVRKMIPTISRTEARRQFNSDK